MNGMLTKAIKWSAIAALIGVALSRSLPGVGLALQLVVAAAAVVVLTQAAKMGRYVWMILFIIAACLFNPVFPLPFSSYMSSLATTFAALLFFFSLELLQPEPTLVTGGIPNHTPGRKSL
jgi:hypothetical protein